MINSPLIILVGPTAVGKTEASIHLAKALHGEIISGDSMQVFKGLDIGTAKITAQEMDGIVHHLIDIKQPEEAFSVAEFKELVDQAIADITSRGKMPILVGGTGFYINSVIYDYDFGNADHDEGYREQLTAISQSQGNEPLHQLLETVDPASAQRIHLNDTKRIIRALEIHHVTGQPMSQSGGGIDKQNLRYPIVYIALDMARETLYQRINQRVDIMMQAGWLEEVQGLLNQGVSPQCLAMQGLGYRQLVGYIQGEMTLERAVELIKRDTRHFAKRQLTWFRHDPNIIWIQRDDKAAQPLHDELISIIRRTITINVE